MAWRYLARSHASRSVRCAPLSNSPHRTLPTSARSHRSWLGRRPGSHVLNSLIEVGKRSHPRGLLHTWEAVRSPSDLWVELTWEFVAAGNIAHRNGQQ